MFIKKYFYQFSAALILCVASAGAMQIDTSNKLAQAQEMLETLTFSDFDFTKWPDENRYAVAVGIMHDQNYTVQDVVKNRHASVWKKITELLIDPVLLARITQEIADDKAACAQRLAGEKPKVERTRKWHKHMVQQWHDELELRELADPEQRRQLMQSVTDHLENIYKTVENIYSTLGPQPDLILTVNNSTPKAWSSLDNNSTTITKINKLALSKDMLPLDYPFEALIGGILHEVAHLDKRDLFFSDSKTEFYQTLNTESKKIIDHCLELVADQHFAARNKYNAQSVKALIAQWISESGAEVSSQDSEEHPALIVRHRALEHIIELHKAEQRKLALGGIIHE